MRFERFFSIGLLIFSAIMCYLALSFTSIISYDPVGAKAFPLLIFSLLTVSLSTMILRRNNYFELMRLTPGIIKKNIVLIVTFTLYAYFFEYASYPLSSMFMIFVLAKIFGGKTIPSLITAVVMSIGSYVLFDLFLDVPLPLGPFNFD